MLRILNITHLDLDGIAAAAAIRVAHPGDHVTVRFASYSSVHDMLKRGCESAIPYDRIILSDISIKVPGCKGFEKLSEREQELILALPKIAKAYIENGGDLVVLDHHETALPMKEAYATMLHADSILEEVDADGVPRAGSELAARYLLGKTEEIMGNMEECEHWSHEDEMVLIEATCDFCELAGDRDVWRDPQGFGGRLALGLELMDDPYGALIDIEDLIALAVTNELSLEEALPFIGNLNYYYEMACNKLDSALALADRSMVPHGERFHQIEAKNFPSDCAMNVYEKTKGVVLITYPGDSRRISFRRHPEVAINLSEFCSRWGGGGHAAAAGVTLNDGDTLETVISAMKEELARLS